MKSKILLCAAILFSALLPFKAQTATVSTENPKVKETQLRQQSFDIVWNTVNERHFDPTFGGVDWKKTREIYEPKAMAAKSLDEFHGVLRQMLGELKLSHFNVFPRPLPSQTSGTGSGTIGAELKMIDGRAVIYRIEKDSPAEKVGLKSGFAVEKIDGRRASEILAPLEKIMIERTYNERVKNIYRERILQSLVDGKSETVLNLQILNSKNELQDFEVLRAADKSEMSPAFGNFPAQKTIFEARRLANNIGYIRFNIWVIPQMSKIRQAIRDFADAKGIIFDLRGNPGGIGGIAMGVAGFFFNEKITLGSMHSRDYVQNFTVFPQPNPFTGKVVVISDYGTVSTSEVFAAGMQENSRAKIVGERSAGAVLPSVFALLPTGAIFQYAISDYKSPKNFLIEGRGVIPDIEVKQTRQALIAGRDESLEIAIKAILN